MKIKLGKVLQAIVMGTALASGAALAQSNVQLYGQIDAWGGEKKALGGPTAVLVGNGGMTASYWGIRGTEDLGGGTSVIFDLESYLNIENGTYGRFTGDGFFSRNAWVGVRGSWGALTLGQIPPPLWFSTIYFNPFFNSFIFSPIVIQTYVAVNGQGVSGNGGEWSNSVLYTAPIVNGLTGKAMYVLGGDTGHLGQNKWSGQLAYNQGPLSASAVWQQIKFNINPGDLSTVLPGLTTQSVASTGLSYDFGVFKIFGQYQHVWDTILTGNVGINTGQLGTSIPVGFGKILASDAYSKSAGTGTSGVSRNTWSVGYDYPLSKSTDIYAAVLGDRASNLSSGHTIGGGVRTDF